MVLGCRHGLLVDRYDRSDRADPAALALHVHREDPPDPADPDVLQGLVLRAVQRDLECSVIVKARFKVSKRECVNHGDLRPELGPLMSYIFQNESLVSTSDDLS